MKRILLLFLSFFIVFGLLNSCTKTVGPKFNSKDFKVALVLSGSVSDSSWNSAAYNGLKRFNQDYKNTSIQVIEKVGLLDAEKVFSKLAEKGFNLVIGHGPNYNETIESAAKKYPKTFFALTGTPASNDLNLTSFSFKDEQYGYLVGIIAGLHTSTNKIGIVVGKKLPSIERTIIGLRKGIKKVNPKADLVVSYINTWNDIGIGREAAIDQINTGVDVITHLADISGVGVIKAAEEADISAIGAIEDQHDLAPTTVISSGIQDASQLIYLACENYVEKTLLPISYKYGLKDQIIDLAPSYGNIDPTTETRINRFKNQLIELEIKQSQRGKTVKRKPEEVKDSKEILKLN